MDTMPELLKKLTDNIGLRLVRSYMLHKELMNEHILRDFKNAYKKDFDEINSPDELIDLLLSTDYNHQKHWWMDWRAKVKSVHYPEAESFKVVKLKSSFE